MGAGSDATWSNIRTRAHTANMGAHAHVLGIRCADGEQRHAEY